jgi:hypothetical protein
LDVSWIPRPARSSSAGRAGRVKGECPIDFLCGVSQAGTEENLSRFHNDKEHARIFDIAEM